LGSFKQALIQSGWWQRTLVFLLSDHGESLGDHGEDSHGYFIYECTLRVPLMVHWPDGTPSRPARDDRPAGLIDVAPDTPNPYNLYRVNWFNDLRRLYHGIPASLAGAAGILLNRKSHFDVVRADSALFGINPVPGSANPMLPVIELSARIVQVRHTTPEHNFMNAGSKQRRFALVSIGHADGFPRSWHPKVVRSCRGRLSQFADRLARTPHPRLRRRVLQE